MKKQTIKNKQNMFLNKSRSVLSFLVAGSVLTACGGMKSNPVDGYDDLRDAGKPKPAVSSKPQLMADAVFKRPSVANDSIPLNFQEGRSSSYTFDAGCFYDGVTYNLIAKNLPDGAFLTRSADPKKPDQFILSWNPNKGTVSTAERGHKTYSFQIMYEVTSTPHAEAASLVMPLNHKTYNYQLNLFSNEQEPEIVKLDVKLGGLDTIQQGDKVAVTIEAVDPGAYGQNIPTLKVEDDRGGATDAKVVKASQAVNFEEAKPVLVDVASDNGGTGRAAVNGKFKFEGMFDSSKIQIPAGASEITARFKVYVKGVSGHNSAALPVNIKILKKAEPSTSAKTDKGSPK